jgi:hypothetical protein
MAREKNTFLISLAGKWFVLWQKSQFRIWRVDWAEVLRTWPN